MERNVSKTGLLDLQPQVQIPGVCVPARGAGAQLSPADPILQRTVLSLEAGVSFTPGLRNKRRNVLPGPISSPSPSSSTHCLLPCSRCRHPGTQQEACEKRLCAGALVLAAFLYSLPDQPYRARSPPRLFLVWLSPKSQLIRDLGITTNNQLFLRAGQRRKMPLKGVLGLYKGKPPCPWGAGSLWLDSSCVQPWRQWIPSSMATGRAENCTRGQRPAKISAMLQQMESAVTQGISRLPLGPGKGFCHPTGQVACYVLRSSFGLVFPHSEAQTDPNCRRATMQGSSTRAQRNLFFICLASIYSLHS